jgi:hypothetical protein
MKSTKEFKAFVNKGVEERYFIGTGNPKAKILIVGKEPHLQKNANEKEKKYFYENAQGWEKSIRDGNGEKLRYPLKEKPEIKESWGKNTWSKYQRLSDFICEKDGSPRKNLEDIEVNFMTHIFTTELNDAPSRNTATADKSRLKVRKQLFKDSAFIQQFPVVILACSNYIINTGNKHEIDDIFGVTYDGDENGGKHFYTKTNWFYTHHDKSGRKLVIHTRQLSANVMDGMLEEMAEVIREHLKKINCWDEVKGECSGENL